MFLRKIKIMAIAPFGLSLIGLLIYAIYEGNRGALMSTSINSFFPRLKQISYGSYFGNYFKQAFMNYWYIPVIGLAISFILYFFIEIKYGNKGKEL